MSIKCGSAPLNGPEESSLLPRKVEEDAVSPVTFTKMPSEGDRNDSERPESRDPSLANRNLASGASARSVIDMPNEQTVKKRGYNPFDRNLSSKSVKSAANRRSLEDPSRS